MDIRDFKAEEIYQLGGEINQLLSKISLQDPFLLRYPGWSPTTVNYEEDEQYNEKVYQVNQLYIRDPKEINAKVKNKDKIQIKLKKKSQ